MKAFLGIDTSNYTTSAALCDLEGKIIHNSRKLLPVPSGERGLRQSDALFSHTKQLSEVVGRLGRHDIAAVGYSAFPRDVEGSYMPCFLCGKAFAESLASLLSVPCYPFSHQRGHIRAALYSCGREDLIGKEYLSFHLSGGTTELLYVNDSEIEIAGRTLDISAGQAIDRVGVMLGLNFPCGAELEKLALDSTNEIKPRISVKGLECNMSGIENRAAKMISDGIAPADIASYTLSFVRDTVIKLVVNAKEKYGDLPIIFAGGVMSNKLIRTKIAQCCDAYFAEGEFSADNASGAALLTYDRFNG